jgi:DNA-binding transcriptional LysR family regulator
MIAPDSALPEQRNPLLLRKCIGRDRLVLVASVTFLSHHAHQDERALIASHLLSYPDGSPLWTGIAERLASRAGESSPKRLFTSPYVSVLKSMVLESQGVSWLPESDVISELGDGRLLRVEQQSDIDYDICLYRRQTGLPLEAERFWRVLS